jgi:hypothetical protein
MAKRITDEDLDLLDELGVDTAPVSSGGRSAREQRIIAGFEEIERFVEEHGRVPQHGESRDIFERIYAVRLDQIRKSAECRDALKDLDPRGLLASVEDPDQTSVEDLSDADLLAELGVEAVSENDLTNLVHVRTRAEIKAAEEVTRRAPCQDFGQFKQVFEQVQKELKSGERKTVPYGGEHADIENGDLFILEGQKVLVAAVGEEFMSEYERVNRRLRVIYDNATESEPLLRSLQRALYEDKTSRRITKVDVHPLFAEEPSDDAGPLFTEGEEDGDLATGYVYVLRSQSDHPFVAEHREVLHKLGVTGGDVKKRVAVAKKDPTYLLADVEIVATYKLANVNRKKLENLLHKFFGAARLDVELKDRFGSQVEPREWFLVPLPVIDEVIQRIKDGTIGGYCYEPSTASLIKT